MLNFYASGCYQRRVGLNAYGSLSQPTVSRLIRRISEAIVVNLSKLYVKFPESEAEMNSIKQKYINNNILSSN